VLVDTGASLLSHELAPNPAPGQARGDDRPKDPCCLVISKTPAHTGRRESRGPQRLRDLLSDNY